MILHITPSTQLPAFWMCYTLPGFTWSTNYGPCWHCEKPTVWIDNAFDTYVHPGRCSEAKADQKAWKRTFELIEEMRRERE